MSVDICAKLFFDFLVSKDGDTIDIGTGILTPVREVVEHLVEITGATVQAQFGSLPNRPFERIRKADIARTQSLIGRKLQTNLIQGLAKTVNWLRPAFH